MMQETRCFDAVVELYTGLGEEDILAGLWKRRCIADETRCGMAALQHGLLTRAQDVFLDAQARATNGSYSTQTTGAVMPQIRCMAL